MLALTLWGAVVLDWLLGEPRRWHPLVGFGNYAGLLEQRFNRPLFPSRKFMGIVALLLAVTPISLLVYWLSNLPYGWLINLIALYLAIGHRSLRQHAEKVIQALQKNDLKSARYAASMLVSRDPEHLDIQKATIESVLENGSDSIFAALFWFVLAGAPGVVAYRLVNTLDAMWGYRNQRFQEFGWCAARLDDLLNYIPARLTALSYCILGSFHPGIRCWQQQAQAHDSPNAGPVMAAGAGSLKILIGGAAIYGGELHQRPEFGCDNAPQTRDIQRAVRLVSSTLILWLAAITLILVITNA